MHIDTGPTRISSRRAFIAATVVTGALLAPSVMAGQPRHPPCPAPAEAIRIEPLAPQVWLIAGSSGDSTPDNQGAISNLIAARDGRRLWLLGSGPTRDYGRALACRLREITGLGVTDVIAPWPRPELVLGQAGLPGARRWAHEQVADAMTERCPRCFERLRERVGARPVPASANLIALPDHRLSGESGRLGPWQWRLLRRSAGTAITVWSLPARGVRAGHGLLWTDGSPDLRDAETPVIQASLRALETLVESAAAGVALPVQWVPEQGPVGGAQTLADHRQYLNALTQAASEALDRGALETDPPPALTGVPAVFTASPRHLLNWQHVWREAEARWMAAPGR